MYCLDRKGDEYTNVTFHKNWLTCWAMFHKYRTCIIDSHSVKHGARGQLINGKLAMHLRTGLGRSATADDTLTCDRSNNSLGSDDVAPTIQGCSDEGRTSM